MKMIKEMNSAHVLIKINKIVKNEITLKITPKKICTKYPTHSLPSKIDQCA